MAWQRSKGELGRLGLRGGLCVPVKDRHLAVWYSRPDRSGFKLRPCHLSARDLRQVLELPCRSAKVCRVRRA